MGSKKFIVVIFLTPTLIYLSFFFIYSLFPLSFHYRAWELFDNLTYNGYMQKSLRVEESGDSTRDYVIQRYKISNKVSLNDIGNRISCFNLNNKKNQTLFLGDSQLFGSGLSDEETLPMQLCMMGNYNIYNGSRIHGPNLLRIKEFNFHSIIFEASEAVGIRSYCNNLPIFYKKTSPQNLEDLKKNLDSKIEWSDLKIKKRFFKKIAMANNFLRNYLSSRIITLFDTSLSLRAPDTNITKYHYLLTTNESEKDLMCAKELKSFFSKRNVKVGFLYIPLKQTIIKDQNEKTIKSIDYIPITTKKMKELGLQTLNTKKCLQNTNAFQTHDSHLNAHGMKILASCITKSDLASLLK